MTAFLRGRAIADDDLLAVVGPGLAPAADATPIPSRDWNHFAFTLGLRLLIVYAHETKSKDHVLDICKTALATLVSVDELLAGEESETRATVGMIEATLRPMTMFAESAAAELQLRIFRWGMRRVHRDRHHHDSLADLARDAASAHAEIAARAGNDADAARDAERAAQRADAATVLAGRAASLTQV